MNYCPFFRHNQIVTNRKRVQQILLYKFRVACNRSTARRLVVAHPALDSGRLLVGELELRALYVLDSKLQNCEFSKLTI